MISCQSAQAVGTAVGKNPWLILIPCHRVLPSSGHIGCLLYTSTLPKPVLEKAQAELLNYQESGMSVLEMSHRSPEFDKIDVYKRQPQGTSYRRC